MGIETILPRRHLQILHKRATRRIMGSVCSGWLSDSSFETPLPETASDDSA
jgi:hypothetical protein